LECVLYKINRETNSIEKLEERLFSDLGFRETDHLQEWIAKNPESLGEELLIIQKEFSGFADTDERLDLLALDKDGNLVIIENKLDDTGRDVVWQALKYTAYCSTLTTEQVIQIYQEYLDKNSSDEDAKVSVMEFLQIEVKSELYLNINDQRIVFVANHYRKEVTSTVFWLLKHNIQIQCFKASPFSMDENEQLFLNIEQIIPQPDTEEFIVSMKEKQKENQKSEVVEASQARLVRFWNQFKQEFSDTGHQHLDRVSVKPRHWIGFGKGKARFGFVVGKDSYRVELYFSNDKDKSLFDAMHGYKDKIEESLNVELTWERLDKKIASRIKIEKSRDSLSDFNQENWSDHFDWYIHTFDNFYKVMLPVLEKVHSNLK